jgi:hypothetical protein
MPTPQHSSVVLTAEPSDPPKDAIALARTSRLAVAEAQRRSPQPVWAWEVPASAEFSGGPSHRDSAPVGLRKAPG